MLLWIPRELHVAHALAAFVALIGAILGIYILDLFGDKLRDYNKRSDVHQAPDCSIEAKNNDPLSASSGMTSDLDLEKVRYSLVDGVDRAAEAFIDITMLGVKQIGLRDKDSHLHVEDVLRNLIKSIAVFVGLSWEKAFDVAQLIVVENVPLLMDHQVVAKVLLALLVCAFMLPGWYWYIMPKALRDRS